MPIQEILNCCISVLLPTDCAICGKNASFYPLPICKRCKNLILAEKPPSISSRETLEGIYSCRFYKRAFRKCIKEFKYHGNRQLLSLFEEIISQFVGSTSSCDNPDPPRAHAPDLRSSDLIIPVPIHPQKRHIRGFNQSELIARILSGCLSLPISSRALIKTRNTASQMALPRKMRVNNLKNSFAVIDRLSLAGKAIILVDDVMTTGVTLESCSRELLNSGAKSVKAFTLARTL